MTLQIGKPYRLPNGEKGICVEIISSITADFSVKIDGVRTHIGALIDNVTLWTEPRTWEDEVRIYEDHGSDCIYRVFASSDVFEHDNRYKLIGRAKVVVQEGGE